MTTTSRCRFQERRRTAKRVTILSIATAVFMCVASVEFPWVEPDNLQHWARLNKLRAAPAAS